VDADGHRLIDFCGSWGASVFGHAVTALTTAIARAARRGLSFGAPTELELELGQLIQKRFLPWPGCALSSGTGP